MATRHKASGFPHKRVASILEITIGRDAPANKKSRQSIPDNASRVFPFFTSEKDGFYIQMVKLRNGSSTFN